MKGTIQPYEQFVKIDKIANAQSLTFETEETVDDKTKRLYVLTEIVKALIMSGGKTFSSDNALLTRAKNISDKILNMADGKTTE